MSELVPRRLYPCNQCPWRRDTPPGMFPTERYEALRKTSGTAGDEAPLDAPMFACHKTTEGREQACAGWLATAGVDHIGVRYAVVTGRIPGSALQPGDDWPDLFDSYAEMAATQALKEPTS